MIPGARYLVVYDGKARRFITQLRLGKPLLLLLYFIRGGWIMANYPRFFALCSFLFVSCTGYCMCSNLACVPEAVTRVPVDGGEGGGAELSYMQCVFRYTTGCEA